jgi:hypothetical protein
LVAGVLLCDCSIERKDGGGPVYAYALDERKLNLLTKRE